MEYRCYFESLDGREYMVVQANPNFDVLRSRFHPKFLYAEEMPTTPEGMVAITQDSPISKTNDNWPRHARGRRLLTMSCGHVTYADVGEDVEACYICKLEVFGACFYCGSKLTDYAGKVGHVWCEKCQTDYDPS